jgi:HEAT repeat protein
MKTKFLPIILATVIIAIVGGVAWRALHPHEPVYGGKNLSMWLDEYVASDGHLPEAEVAIRHIGTNAIPQVLKMLAAKDSAFKGFVINLARRQTLVSIGRPEAAWQHGRAFQAIEILGPDAALTVPGLINLFDDKETGTRVCALNSFLFLGPSGSNAVPAIIQHIGDKDADVRKSAVLALGKIHCLPKLAVPALQASLHDSDPYIAMFAVHGLGAFGADAKPAVPALVELLKDQNPKVRGIATNALKAIDPEAAAKAGVQ